MPLHPQGNLLRVWGGLGSRVHAILKRVRQGLAYIMQSLLLTPDFQLIGEDAK